MSIKPRNRISTDEDMKKAKDYIGRQKLHKISLYIPADHVKKMKLRALEEEITLTDIFQKLVKEYLELP